MKSTKHPFDVLLLFTCSIASLVGAAHTHHRHGDIVERIMHHKRPSSESNPNSNGTESAQGTFDPSFDKGSADNALPANLEDSTIPAMGCHGLECGLNPIPTPILPPGQDLQEVHIRSLVVESALAVTPSRRRPHTRPTSTTDDHSQDAHNLSRSELPQFTRPELKPRQDDGYQSFQLGPFPKPTSTISAAAQTTSDVCPGANGTSYTSDANIPYQVICNLDFQGHDFPFQHVGSFEGCVQKCDAWNYINHHVQCIAALYVPYRLEDADDCYLKSDISNPSDSPYTIQAAIRLTEQGFAASDTSATFSQPATIADSSATSLATASATRNTPSNTSAISDTASSAVPTSATATAAAATSAAVTSADATSAAATAVAATSASATSAAPSASGSTAPSGSEPGVTYASGNDVIAPLVKTSHLQGPTQNTPSTQYIAYNAPKSITLSNSLLKVGVNGDLTTGYDISLETGILEVNVSTQSHLKSLTNTPHLSRDGGQGGYINGEHLFIFCDTGSYSTTTSSSNGRFLGFTSSSVAIDSGMNGLQGKALNLVDGIGEWSDDNGRLRGFLPFTEGEQAYNLIMQGAGQRYAIWPESSVIPLDATSGIMFAPIVYDNVNRDTKAAVFTYTGATLVTVTAGGKAGPIATRTVKKIFDQDEVEWGCAGGIRSWGQSGIGGDDGKVYIFGNIQGGILLGRTNPADIADRNSFEYWNGGDDWTNTTPTSSSKNFFASGPFMDISIFYSPRHLTFIIVYLTVYADSTFYYRYLKADNGILPPFAPGGDRSSDYVENLYKYEWSDEQVLYKAAQGLSGKYIYAGAVHEGYYGSNDITNGGSKMLISWTAPTGKDPASLVSEYQIITAEVDWV